MILTVRVRMEFRKRVRQGSFVIRKGSMDVVKGLRKPINEFTGKD